ncbi:MAG: enoyl-CoA hydratase/isomerase family protein [Hyphomonadaceae bacterium]|nr:enoyl-CoA hydratase/isomerase family protein [Hyphomonadaceae bacterium]
MTIMYEKRGHVGIVTMSRPEARNCWGDDFAAGLEERFAEIGEDDEIHCAILTGDEAGKAFCSGANLKDPTMHGGKSPADFIKSIPAYKRFIFNVLTECPKPIVAAVNGYAIGIGCIMTYCCDLIVASDCAEWRLPQSQIGILPAYGGTARLARWVGKGDAMKLALGFPLSADDALRIGLAQWVVPHSLLMSEALRVAQHLSSQSPLALRLVKESITSGLDNPNIGSASLTDIYRQHLLALTADREEGHEAWRERRAPKFVGQ